jgi:SAM-dependent methyltransferase
MRYPDAVNPDLLIRIPLDARSVLDIGCGTAATGLEYKRRNPGVVYSGIEQDDDAIALAAQRIDNVVKGNVETMPWAFGDEKFDCIVLGDVLEHLQDPWAVLSLMRQKIGLNGVILICMPNLEHWSFAARLLSGGWDYHPTGLFDRTHLRWFTFDTTLRAIREAGLLAHDVAGRIFDAEACQAFVQRLTPALTAMEIDPVEYQRRALPMQHVWRAVPEAVQRTHVVSTMLAPIGGVSQVRVSDPMDALATLPDMFAMVIQSAEIPDFDRTSPKIFIFHRPLLLGEEGLLPIRQLIGLGYIIVCEFDDHPDYIPVLQRPDVQNFRAVHAIQTSTSALADVLSRENPEVRVFPNAVPRLAVPQNFAHPDRMSLFFGSLNRESEWPQYLAVLNDIAEAAGSRLHFQIVNDQGLYDSLITPYKTFTPLCDYETYKTILSKCEISFMPLSDTPFNRCKSDLKYLEAASHRVATLASPMVYGDVVSDGVNGVIYRSPEDLHRRLLAMLALPEQTKRMADASYQYVKQHRMLSAQIRDRATWYKELWERRHDLNDALLSRVPELGDGRPDRLAFT